MTRQEKTNRTYSNGPDNSYDTLLQALKISKGGPSSGCVTPIYMTCKVVPLAVLIQTKHDMKKKDQLPVQLS